MSIASCRLAVPTNEYLNIDGEVRREAKGLKKWYPRQGSNLRPFAPEANALIH